MGLTSGAGRASAEPSLPRHYRPPPVPAPPPPLSRPTHRGPRPPLRARDRGGPGAAPARRARTRGTGRARRQRAGGAGMRVRRRGREGPAPSLVPAGAAGEPPRPRAPASFGAARSFMSTGSRRAPPAGTRSCPRSAARRPRTPARPRGRPRLPPLGVPGGASACPAVSPPPPRAAPLPPARPRPRPLAAASAPASARPPLPCPRRSLPTSRGRPHSPAAPVRSGDQGRAGGGARAAGWLGGDEPSAPPPLEGTCGFPQADIFLLTEPQHHVHGSGSVSLRVERRRLNPCRAAPLPTGRAGIRRHPGSRPGTRLTPGRPSRWAEAGPLGPLREIRTPREQTPPHRSPTQPNRQQTSTCSTAGDAKDEPAQRLPRRNGKQRAKNLRLHLGPAAATDKSLFCAPSHKTALPACPAGKFISCLQSHPTQQRTGLRQAHASPRHRAERCRCGAGAPSHSRLSSLQSPQVAPTCHHLGLGLLLSDPSYRGPATILSESQNYKAIIYAATGILFFCSKGIYETRGQ
uniref:uncharacterized protein n=1 Tax=Lonchura striata TaxID=40157 RepID=UPI000B4DEC9E|nr:uncharacterized protein LOC110479219 [Lonchura striata domestica]